MSENINTLRNQRSDLATFTQYLVETGLLPPVSSRIEQFQTDPTAWANITYGVISGFVRWLVANNYALDSVNRKLWTVRAYARNAYEQGVLSTEQYALMLTIKHYDNQVKQEVDTKRITKGIATRKAGSKKALPIELTAEQAKALKTQPDTPQGRRDALLMCLLLDHGLRRDETIQLELSALDLRAGTLTFYRSFQRRTETLRLSEDTLRILRSMLLNGDLPESGKLLRRTRKSGRFDGDSISSRAIGGRVLELGERIGVKGLSPNDARHYWLTSQPE